MSRVRFTLYLLINNLFFLKISFNCKNIDICRVIRNDCRGFNNLSVRNELDYRVDVCGITKGAHNRAPVRYVTKTWSVVLLTLCRSYLKSYCKGRRTAFFQRVFKFTYCIRNRSPLQEQKS